SRASHLPRRTVAARRFCVLDRGSACPYPPGTASVTRVRVIFFGYPWKDLVALGFSPGLVVSRRTDSILQANVEWQHLRCCCEERGGLKPLTRLLYRVGKGKAADHQEGSAVEAPPR